MIIGAGLDSRLGLPFDQLRSAGREAEQLGFASLWTPAGGVPDSFHTCAAWSQDTSLRTGISVVPAPRMWTPLSLAAQTATLAQLSAGRFVLGIGTGGYSPAFWASVGLPNRPIAVMREYVTVLQRLLAGEQVTVGEIITAEGTERGVPGWPHSATLGVTDLPAAIDDDVAAARRAFATSVLDYALGRPGSPNSAGYRGLFGQMGFDAELTELEQRRTRGATMAELTAAAPDEMLRAVGYFGPAAAAPAAFARLSAGLDEAMVRVITARPGLEPVVAALEALTPQRIAAA